MTPRKPRAPELFTRGVKSFRAGNIEQAKSLFADAIRADAAHAGAHHGLGLIALQQGDAAAAVAHIQRATEADPGNAAHFLNLGVALRKLQRQADALAAYDRALMLDPDSPTAHNNRGNLLRDMERTSAALKDYDRALALQPGYAEAHYNRGVLLQKVGRLDDALAALGQAIELRPGYVDACNSRGNVLRDLGRWDEAGLEYGVAIAAAKADPDTASIALADAHYNRAAVLRDQGERVAAVADLHAALALRPDFPQARWALAFAGLTPVYDGMQDMAAARERFADELESLSADCLAGPAKMADWEPAVGAAQPFYLAYHGFNERELLSGYGALTCSVMADWHRRHGGASRPAEAGPTGDTAPWGRVYPGHTAQSGQLRDRIRVGFVSAQVHRHSVWDVLTRGWLTQLDRKQFDVTCYHVGWRRDRETALARKSAGTFVMGPRPLSAWVDRITNDRMDVLIYPEIGMDPMTVKLAALRLAPVQCTVWGHPLTSGLPTLDYFLSGDLLEPSGAEAHYIETLVRLPNLGCYFEPLNAEASRPAKAGPTNPSPHELHPAYPVGPASAGLSISRRDESRPTVPWHAEATDRMWNIPREDIESPRFICCQQVAKYHPGYDEVFARIAEELGRCRFTFVELARTHAAWERFRLRLGRAFAARGLDSRDYCSFLPTLPRNEFLALLKQQDVYLDTLSFSGFTTAIQALSCDGLPVVTLEGDLLRKRLAAGILRRIGVTDTIAASVDEYVEIAVRLARDTEWRAELRTRITDNLDRAYRDEGVIRALEEFLAGRASARRGIKAG